MSTSERTDNSSPTELGGAGAITTEMGGLRATTTDRTTSVSSAEAGGNSALDVAMARVGDRWTLLVVDALLDGPRRFKDLESAVPGLAPNILSARLRRLEREGIIDAVPYSDKPTRYEYRVSDEGRELAGALRLLSRWGARSAGGEVEGPRHRSCGTLLEARWYCPTCERVTDRADDDIAWL